MPRPDVSPLEKNLLFLKSRHAVNGVDHPEDPDLFCSSLPRASSPGDLQLERTLTLQRRNRGYNKKETLWRYYSARKRHQADIPGEHG